MTATTAAFPSGQTAIATYTMDTSANGLLNTQDLSTVDYPSGAGCYALYEMNGNSNDTNNTYNGTPANITYQGGAFDQAAVFNGSSSYIATPSIIPANNFSFSVWVNLDVIPTSSSNLQIIYNVNRFADNVRWYISVTTGGKIEAWNGANTFVTSANQIVNAGQWYYITYTASSTTGKKIYVNGVEVYTTNDTGDNQGTATTTDWQAFGRYFVASNPFYFDGKLDQARIFNAALTQAQVTTLARDIATSYSGAATNVNFNGHLNFQPDFVWIKSRTANAYPNNVLQDSVRGPNQYVISDLTNGQATNATFGSFDSNGFTLTTNNVTWNGSGSDYVSWNWKAGGAAVANNDGTLPSQVSANKDSGFSIVKYTSTGTSGSTVGHGLSSAPEIVIFKCISTTGNWITSITNIISNKYLYLNNTGTGGTGGFSIDGTNITLNNTYGDANTNGRTYVAYCWHSVAGYSKMGSYPGNSSTNKITLDFAPSWIMIKLYDVSGGDWFIYDNKRNPTNPADLQLEANTAGAETDHGTAYELDFLSDGFELKGAGGAVNYSGRNYLYMAIA